MKFIQTILLALISLSVSGRCFILHQNETDNVSKIEGGSEICIKEVPYQVILKSNGKYICGGALIEPNIVLTAAHCIYSSLKSPKTLSVVAGTHSTKLYFGHSFIDKSIEIFAEEIKPYPRYNKKSADSVNYDLGLIKLADNFPTNGRIQPISLPKHNVQVNDELIVTGVGMDKANSGTVSRCLKYYKPKVVDCTKFVRNIRNGFAIICHQDKSGNRTHGGDSGGPMVNARKELVGVHSGTDSTGKFQVAINVYHYLDWIQDSVNDYFSNEI